MFEGNEAKGDEEEYWEGSTHSVVILSKIESILILVENRAAQRWVAGDSTLWTTTINGNSLQQLFSVTNLS